MQNKPDFAAQEIFHAALDHEGAGRERFLSRMCGADMRLRREVESLLASFDKAGDFLETPMVRDVRPSAASAAGIGDLIGRYRIVDVLSSGGMGEVYRAVRADGAFEQQVAIKMIRSDALSPESQRRFARERQTLAHLEHPYITRLIDGGAAADGRPYLVIEYVEGLPIDRFCVARGLDIRRRLELFRKVCEAVHHAHRNLVVHRDLKPANILVTCDGTPKVLDFGIAKLLDEVGRRPGAAAATTVFRPLTPGYASPEQIKGHPITTASDIYSLGVLLYELLAGVHPHPLHNGAEWDYARVTCECDPPAPSAALTRGMKRSPAGVTASPAAARSLRRQLRGDLDNIVLMALQKDAARRYGSVQQLAEDVDRYLHGAPVIARRDTFAYRASKWVRRNTAVAIVSASLLVALLLGVTGTTIGMMRAESARDRAESERLAALRAQSEAEFVTAFLQDTLSAANPFRHGREVGVIELLEQAADRIETELADSPGVEAGVRYAIANTYAGMWEWERAIPHLRIALQQNRAIRGDYTPATADCLNLLGRAMTFQRDAESIALQAEGLAIRRVLFGERHKSVAESLGNLGFAEWHGQEPPDWQRAEHHYRAALAMYHSLGIEIDADVARFTYSLGVMLANRGRHQEAEELYKTALRIYEGLPVTQDCYRARCMSAYSQTLMHMGRTEEARIMLQEMGDITPPGYRPPRLGS